MLQVIEINYILRLYRVVEHSLVNNPMHIQTEQRIFPEEVKLCHEIFPNL